MFSISSIIDIVFLVILFINPFLILLTIKKLIPKRKPFLIYFITSLIISSLVLTLYAYWIDYSNEPSNGIGWPLKAIWGSITFVPFNIALYFLYRFGIKLWGIRNVNN